MANSGVARPTPWLPGCAWEIVRPTNCRIQCGRPCAYQPGGNKRRKILRQHLHQNSAWRRVYWSPVFLEDLPHSKVKFSGGSSITSNSGWNANTFWWHFWFLWANAFCHAINMFEQIKIKIHSTPYIKIFQDSLQNFILPCQRQTSQFGLTLPFEPSAQPRALTSNCWGWHVIEISPYLPISPKFPLFCREKMSLMSQRGHSECTYDVFCTSEFKSSQTKPMPNTWNSPSYTIIVCCLWGTCGVVVFRWCSMRPNCSRRRCFSSSDNNFGTRFTSRMIICLLWPL